jgi:beta-galactosidase/beta-glucuronidase
MHTTKPAAATTTVAATGYPRPQLVRTDWASLDGSWDFAYDDEDCGLREHWERAVGFDLTITVPFPPESPDSGVRDERVHRICWYHRRITDADLRSAGSGGRHLLHFGAADYETRVWVDGRLAGTHRGGQSPFSFDITEVLDSATAEHHLVVRCLDDPDDVEAARGKQDWRDEPHAVWYERTSGIWQPVWLESVPPIHVRRLDWESDATTATAKATVRLSRRPAGMARVRVQLSREGRPLARCEVECESDLVEVPLVIGAQRNGQEYEQLVWSPERPVLIDASVEVEADGCTDQLESYLGLRSVATEQGRFLLNDRPYSLRAVLSQGYWPGSHLAAPSPDALRDEVELIRALGFNAVRIHQKAEDPRFLFWCDYLGLAVWAESGSAYQYSADAVGRFTREWLDLVERDRSHPSVVTWVPLNESWGVQHISHDPSQQAFARAIADLTRAVDPSRPVVSNDGWEHTSSDIVTVHDYSDSAETLRARYGDSGRLAELLDGLGPAGRRMRASEPGWPADAPVMLTEFGGIAYSSELRDGEWGYSSAADGSDYQHRLDGLVGAVRDSVALAGFCYTQLADTRQEVNGLCDEHRRPKLPPERIRAIVTGTEQD